MPLRSGIEPDDIVTPVKAARILRVPASTVRTWIERYGIEQVGTIGRWPVYDFRDIAAADPGRRRRRKAQLDAA